MVVADVDGGPGWIIRGADLRPEIIDAASFRRGMAGDPLADAVELLWTGHPDRALALLEGHGQSPRVRALVADCHGALGDVGGALRMYDDLVDASAGTRREATMRQHRGKVRLAAGDVDGAVDDFRIALELRQDADAALLASSTQALGVAFARRQAVRHR